MEGLLTNLESLTYEHARTDLNAITKIFISRKIRKIWKLLETYGNSWKTQVLWEIDLWLRAREDYTFIPWTSVSKNLTVGDLIHMHLCKVAAIHVTIYVDIVLDVPGNFHRNACIEVVSKVVNYSGLYFPQIFRTKRS